ncbi:hypothetical protein PTSG_03958 [Salpingoeca rosetta]|uniref:Glutathione S-transferase n=1 Tax=Salpingoeca rosetta (strain ATCC 50818 / BSB-021) TaxID=946362 RepID=F2U7D3_SALR5|nr:uncharacterized protein PTSG_03958 [Salpingoeca rosetta]EGD83350.1 hypothetical protein PTSG_03958 [Salpingoeca rosetta]|eukprot:XP_004994854.1 hypothetical protein PTSG_03958 [Salpingoeca rosetta]
MSQSKEGECNMSACCGGESPMPTDGSKPKYRLVYFDIRGRAEPARLAFHLAGVEFADVRVSRDQWCKLKPKCPYGQLPILQVDGQIIAQSSAIIRFVGKKTNLYPEDHMEAARVDEVIGLIEDINWLIIPTIKERDMERKLAMRRELATDLLPRWLAVLNCKFSNGYVLGPDRISIADLTAFTLIGWLTMGVMDGIPKTIVDKHANLKALQARIAKQPNLQAYFDKHYSKDPVEQAKVFMQVKEYLTAALNKKHCCTETSEWTEKELNKLGDGCGDPTAAAPSSSSSSSPPSSSSAAAAKTAAGGRDDAATEGPPAKKAKAAAHNAQDNKQQEQKDKEQKGGKAAATKA